MPKNVKRRVLNVLNKEKEGWLIIRNYISCIYMQVEV